MEEKIYCEICKNCIKQCNFSQYDIKISTHHGNDVNGEIITWKCENFVPIYVAERSRSCNDIFFTKKTKVP